MVVRIGPVRRPPIRRPNPALKSIAGRVPANPPKLPRRPSRAPKNPGLGSAGRIRRILRPGEPGFKWELRRVLKGVSGSSKKPKKWWEDPETLERVRRRDFEKSLRAAGDLRGRVHPSLIPGWDEYVKAWEQRLIEMGYSPKAAKEAAPSMAWKDLQEDWREYVSGVLWDFYSEASNPGYVQIYWGTTGVDYRTKEGAYLMPGFSLTVWNRRTGRKASLNPVEFARNWKPDFEV